MRPDLEKFRLPPLLTAAGLRIAAASILTPPPDIDVAEAAERYRHLYNPGGGYSGPWRNPVAPYLVGPMRALTDPRYNIVVEVAPAQSAKTELGLNFAGYAIEVDPSDFQIVLPEKQLAEDFSERRLKRMVDASPHYSARLRERKLYLAKFDRCLVNLSWPTSSNASSKPVPRNWLDERDSMSDDVDGEGDPVALYDKRSQTFGSRRMTLVTSSPKRNAIKGAPPPTGKHEAPATTGILALYNQGTRRQFYWPCRTCGEYFVTRGADLVTTDGAKSDDRVLDVWFACPHCGGIHGDADRRELWNRGHWLAEGEEIDALGAVTGSPRFTNIDSYWLFGPQAAFITLEELVRKRLRAEETKARTGSETELRTYTNVDCGEVYTPANDADAPRSPEELQHTAPDLPLARVPAWAETLIAAVDVQADRFEIGWQAFGPGNESALVDIQKLIAVDESGKAVLAGGGSGGAISATLDPADPAGKLEHWVALVEAVFDRPLALSADPTRGLRPACVVIDTGGKAGTTDKAYKFARWLRRTRPDLSRRVMFIKGRGGRNPIRLMRAPWEAKVTPRGKANRKGVDLWILWVNELKDAIDARLRRALKQKGERGDETLHVSRNLPAAVFDQLCAETKNENDEWENTRNVANEAFDLVVYGHAGWIRLGGEKIDWAKPPRWAQALNESEQISAAIGAPAKAAEPVKPPPPADPPPLPRSRAARAGRLGGGWVNSWRN